MNYGRPPKSSDQMINVGKFSLNAASSLDRRLAKYLLHAPRGARTSRMLMLILAGYRVHLQNTGTELNLKRATKIPRTVHVDDVPFDTSDIEQACCLAYINAAKWRLRRSRVIALMRAGYSDFEQEENRGRGVQ